ncbi:MAG: amidohydrolase [Lentisphaerae bacterium]|nr:amidohydrolase [Lentisphaerota bacterium]
MFYRMPEKYHTVDVHNHVWFKNGTLDGERMHDLLIASDLLGIEKLCVSVPLTNPYAAPEKCRQANDVTYQAMQYSDRLLGFCFADAAGGEEMIKEVDRCICKLGMVGIKMYHQHKLQDRIQKDLMQRAAELGVPVLMHAAMARNAATIERGPLCSHAGDFLEALEVYPDTMFIQGHIGGGGDWQWNLRTLETIESDNYWIDLSGSVIDAGILRDTVDAVGADRVLFATDGSFEEAVGKLQAAHLSEAEILKITSGNFNKIMQRRKVAVKNV